MKNLEKMIMIFIQTLFGIFKLILILIHALLLEEMVKFSILIWLRMLIR
jgi:hypothetical protein